jgi:RNA polymerase subunit RPABC4/transcription elongation factor Spt4
VRVLICGEGFGKEKPAPAGNRLDILAKDDAAIIQAGVMPVRPGSDVELELSVTFETMNQKNYTVGPFQAFFTVQEKDAHRVNSVSIGSFQYIGPGGLNAQDAVVIRPNYQQSSKSESISEVVNNLINAESAQTPKEHIRRAFYCQKCGRILQPGAARCSNSECNTRLCVYCGSVLGEGETSCPVCNESQSDNHS